MQSSIKRNLFWHYNFTVGLLQLFRYVYFLEYFFKQLRCYEVYSMLLQAVYFKVKFLTEPIKLVCLKKLFLLLRRVCLLVHATFNDHPLPICCFHTINSVMIIFVETSHLLCKSSLKTF